MRLVSKACFAEKIDVSRSAVTQATKEGKALFYALVNDELDLEHESVKRYLFSKDLGLDKFLALGYSEDFYLEYKSQREAKAKKKTSKAVETKSQPTPSNQASESSSVGDYNPKRRSVNFHDNQSLMSVYGNKTLFELIAEFGSDDAFSRFANGLKTLAEIEKKKLEIAKQRGEVIDRGIVKKYVFGAIETGNQQLLTDLPGNITRLVINSDKVGKPKESIEKDVQQMISQVLKDVKETSQRMLKNA